MSGAGSSSAGRGPYTQIGTTTTPGGAIMRDENSGAVLSSRRIDPRTGDYVVDEFGRITGMTRAQQFVLLAVKTVKGSAAVTWLGNELNTVQTIGASYQRQVEAIFRDALAPGEAQGLLEIIAISVERTTSQVGGNTAIFVRITWRDLETGREQETFA